MNKNTPLEKDKMFRLSVIFAVGVFIIGGCAYTANTAVEEYYAEEGAYYQQSATAFLTAVPTAIAPVAGSEF